MRQMAQQSVRSGSADKLTCSAITLQIWCREAVRSAIRFLWTKIDTSHRNPLPHDTSVWRWGNGVCSTADNGTQNSIIVKRTSMITIVSVGHHIQGGCEGSISGGNDCGKGTVTRLSHQYVRCHILNCKNSALSQHSVLISPVRCSHQTAWLMMMQAFCVFCEVESESLYAM